MTDMTTSEAGRELATLAKLTAAHSKDWDNFAKIAESMLQQAFDAGPAAALLRRVLAWYDSDETWPLDTALVEEIRGAVSAE